MDSSAPKELKDMYRIVCTMYVRPESSAFRQPVDWKGLGLLDYPQIIKKPMDLGSIKQNLENNKYESKEQVAADVRLVWTNCMLYNSDGSEFYHLADKFARGFEEAYKMLSRDDTPADVDRVPSVDEKIQLSHDIFKIGNTELARALTMIEESCPYAICKRTASDEVLVNFDALTPKCFHTVFDFVLNSMVAQVASKKGKKRKADAVKDGKDQN